MDKTAAQLEALLVHLRSVPPCEEHGAEAMAVCMDCGESVYCEDCEPLPCQCWNDE